MSQVSVGGSGGGRSQLALAIREIRSMCSMACPVRMIRSMCSMACPMRGVMLERVEVLLRDQPQKPRPHLSP